MCLLFRESTPEALRQIALGDIAVLGVPFVSHNTFPVGVRIRNKCAQRRRRARSQFRKFSEGKCPALLTALASIDASQATSSCTTGNGAQGGPRDLGQPRQAKDAWWKAPGVVCGCRFTVRTGGRGPDLGVRSQSQAYRKIRCPLRGGF